MDTLSKDLVMLKTDKYDYIVELSNNLMIKDVLPPSFKSFIIFGCFI